MRKYFTINGNNYDEDTALPNPEAQAMMLNYVGGQWELSGWGGVIEEDGAIVNDWELLAVASTFDEIVKFMTIYAEDIEEEGAK